MNTAIPVLQKKEEGALPAALYQTLLFIGGAFILWLIALVKSHSIESSLGDPILVGYTLFVTSFELTRLVAALYYERSFSHVSSETVPLSYEPTISFVIPCKNEEKTIGMTIDKCFAAEYPTEKVEVIVINDGSTDGTRAALFAKKQECPALHIVDWTVNRGKRHGMAEGFTRATGEIIIQLDSDSYIDPKTVRHLIAPFYHQEIGAVCAHAEPANADRNLLTRMQTAYYFLSFRILKAAESTFMSVFCCSGCSSAYRKSVVTPILTTWLNETFLGLPVTWGDDRGLTNWVLKLGYKTVYTDEARAFTLCPETWKVFFKQQVRWKKGWFVNSIFASRFIYKERPFVAITYFFPLILVTLIAPFMAVRAFIYYPLLRGVLPVYYVAGALLIACLITLFYRYVARKNRYWPYVLAWSIVNTFFLSMILFYALATIQNRAWGTR